MNHNPYNLDAIPEPNYAELERIAFAFKPDLKPEADRIIGILKERKVSAAMLSRKLGVGHNTAWRWLNSKAAPNASSLEKLRDFLEV